MKRIIGFVVSALTALFIAVPAAAHVQTVLDPDDTPGPLDTVAARVKHFRIAETHPERHRTVLTFKLVTYETWPNDRLSGVDNHVTFEFNLDSDDGVERCFEIRQREDGELQGQMFSRGCEFVLGEPVGKPRNVSRPDEHSLKASFRKRLLGKSIKAFRWRAVTSFDENNDSQCPRPDPLPPERRYATCTDSTKWSRHRV